MSGMLGQLGFKSETTWGTGVTVDQFHPGYLSGNPVREQPPLVSKGIRAGRRTATSVQAGAKIVEGQFSLELYNRPLATLLRHMFGTIGVSGVGPWTHTASPGTLAGKSFTAQVGIAGTGGTVHPFTYSGCKIEEWTLKGVAGELAVLDLDVTAKDYVTATGLAAASYNTGNPFTFVQGSVSINSVAQADIEEFELVSRRPLRKQHAIGSATILEQLEEGPAEYAITCKADFASLTLHDLQNTGIAVVLAFANGTDTLTVTTNAWVNPATPETEGIDSMTEFEFSATPYGTTDAAAITAVLVSATESVST
jgi:hypothetical protein